MPDKTGDPRIGVRFSPAMASIVANLTTIDLHLITPGRTAVVRKIMWSNRNAAASMLRIGSGDFNQRLPDIWMAPGLDGVMVEEELPRYEFRILADVAEDITAQATVAAAAPNDIQVSIEVEEFEEQ